MGCKEWLKKHMSDGELHLSTEVTGKAKTLGYSRSELRRVRNELEVKTFHQFDEVGATDNWFWFMEV